MAFSRETIDAVWAKSSYVDSENERSGFRKDACTAWIKRSEYGNRDSDYGWEIDHIRPVADGGTDSLSNLRPMHWENNAAKSDGRSVCVVTSSGTRNVRSATVRR